MRVAIFGCGVAGLTVAHELGRLGHEVQAFEALAEPGGFFRSARRPGDRGMPTEYSWHGMGPWYHNVFDLLQGIPAAGGAKQLISGPAHAHCADAEGPAWRHGSGDGWLLLRGPSSEAWCRSAAKISTNIANVNTTETSRPSR